MRVDFLRYSPTATDLAHRLNRPEVNKGQEVKDSVRPHQVHQDPQTQHPLLSKAELKVPITFLVGNRERVVTTMPVPTEISMAAKSPADTMVPQEMVTEFTVALPEAHRRIGVLTAA